jgi:pimeloyl-ACP methyl ester carboxylesterase
VLGLPALTLSFKPDELYRVPTDDGASIALGRYHPRGPRRFAEPVLLCHGLGANRFNLDFDEHYSVARYLARRGFETWVIELRCRGLAGPMVETTFDDQAEHDVRAAIRTVRSTGADKVLWIGHSKGGLAAFAHGARNPDAPFTAIVAVGSPVTFQVQPGLRKFIQTVAPLLKMKSIPTGRVKAIAHLGAPPGPLSRYMVLAANMDPLVVKQSLANMASDIPGGVGRQFGQWISTGKFDSFDHSFDYRAHMAAIHCPVLLLAGSRDLLAPPMAVARAKDFLGCAAKLVVCGKTHGFLGDYGHGDLILGRHAPNEVFPVIESFLAQHAKPV